MIPTSPSTTDRIHTDPVPAGLLPLSVVIPVRDAEDFVADCLRSVLANRPAEVVVVDGRSTDDTLEIVFAVVDEHRRRGGVVPRVDVVDDDGAGVAAARMLGLRRARQRTVALIDVDVVLGDGVLAHWLAEYTAGQYVGLQALCEPEALTPGYWGRALAAHQRMSRSRHWFGLSATLVRRETLLAQGLDPRFRSGEDIEFRHRMERAGHKIGVSRKITVRHRFRDGFEEARHQWRDDGAGLARMVRKNGLKDARLLALPLAAWVRGLAMTAVPKPWMLPYWACFVFFNYVSMGQTLVSRRALDRAGDQLGDPLGDRLGLAGNSGALSLARIAPMALGFITWTVAARGFDAHQVGLAAAAVTAAGLISQLAVAGQGHALVLLLPGRDRGATRLVGDGALMALTAGLASAALLAGLAAVLSRNLRELVDSPGEVLLFLALGTATSLAYYFDHVAIARRRSDRAVGRSLLQAGFLLTAAVAGTVAAGDDGLLVLLVGATAGVVASAAVGAVQEHRDENASPHEPAIGSSVPELARVGAPNLVLTLTSRAPMFALPFVVTELVSPASNAAWYAAWMMSMAIWFVPNSVALSTQARLALPGADERREVAAALRTALVLGTLAAAGVALVGPFLLAFMGPVYAEATTALWVLTLTVLPVTLSEVWLAVRRRRRRWALPATVNAVVGATALVVAVQVAGSGLTALALVWLAAQLLLGALATVLLLREVGSRPAAVPASRGALAREDAVA